MLKIINLRQNNNFCKINNNKIQQNLKKIKEKINKDLNQKSYKATVQRN